MSNKCKMCYKKGLKRHCNKKVKNNKKIRGNNKFNKKQNNIYKHKFKSLNKCMFKEELVNQCHKSRYNNKIVIIVYYNLIAEFVMKQM